MRAPRLGLAALIAVAVVLVSRPARAAEGAAAHPPSLGFLVDSAVVPEGLAPLDPDRPLDARVTADWAAVETTAGVFDWSSLAASIGALHDRHVRVTLCVRGDNPFHPAGDRRGEAPDAAWLAAWTAFVRSAVATLGGSISTIELGERPDAEWSASVYAFVLKSSALAARAEAKSAGVSLRVAQGIVSADALDWERQLLAEDAAAYVDVLPVAVAGGDAADVVASFQAETLERPPAPEIRIDAMAPAGAGTWASLGLAVRSLAAGAPVALSAPPTDPSLQDRAVAIVAALSSRLAGGYAPAPPGGLALKTPEGTPAAGASILGRFLRAKDFATLVVYEAPAPAAADTQARLVLDTRDVKAPVVIDLPTGAEYKTGPAEVPGETKRSLRILLSDHPMAVAWERVSENTAGLDLRPEDVLVKTTRGLTAQEIIARNQEVQKVQDDRLSRWTAAGRVDFHYKLAQGGSSLDVAIESRYFWAKGGALEWEQRRYYINGNVVTWKKIPELPLVQPEKVLVLPLDLTFDKTYDYRLAGEDTVSGRAAYVLAFEPAARGAARSLYSGRVWIDKETFVRLKTSVVQAGLEPPVISNEETDTYRSVTGPDGAPYVLIGAVDGQQLWSFAGRNFVVHRELRFSDFEINPAQERFDQAVAEAYASDHQVLRDTDKGFRYLVKGKDGVRTVREQLRTSALFAAAGAFKDSSIASVAPLAGVNWFDYDWLKKKIQVNVFFAGVYAYLNLTDASIGGSKADLGGEASLVGLKLDDKLFVDGEEDVTQRVRRRSQYVTARVGYPIGSFVKLAAIGDLSWNQYTDSSDANEALAAQNARDGTNLTFVLPADHQVYAGTVQVEFNRKAYSLTAAGTYSRRSTWDRWGLFDMTTGNFLDTTFDSKQKSFETWLLTAFKEWYLPKFQKLKVEADYLDGSNLDRFSQFRFGTFGDASLVGFSGTGVRFDTGYIARAGWAFNLVNVIRFNLSLENGWVRDRLADDRLRSHFGAGLSFNVVGPWKTIWQGSYGRAIRSDIPALEGKQEFLLVVLKLF